VRILCALQPDARHASVHAADSRGLVSATEAFRLILTRIRGGGFLIRTGAYKVYPWVVRHRTRIGRFVPNLPRPPVS
jgi:hypothetical protein